MSQEPDTGYLLGVLAEDREIVAQIEESIDLLRGVMGDYRFGPGASASLFAYIEGMNAVKTKINGRIVTIKNKMKGELTHG
ncbi:MAG: hypothetical protein ACYCSO_05560 [Cuniculiplasma sp.]